MSAAVQMFLLWLRRVYILRCEEKCVYVSWVDVAGPGSSAVWLNLNSMRGELDCQGGQVSAWFPPRWSCSFPQLSFRASGCVAQPFGLRALKMKRCPVVSPRYRFRSPRVETSREQFSCCVKAWGGGSMLYLTIKKNKQKKTQRKAA